MERMISMFGIPEHIVERLKKEYPKGTRVELIEMNDPFRHIPQETTYQISVRSFGTMTLMRFWRI